MLTSLDHTCVNEPEVERYLLRHLDERENAALEEKLLICGRCRDVFSQEESFFRAMRPVMARHRQKRLTARKAVTP